MVMECFLSLSWSLCEDYTATGILDSKSHFPLKRKNQKKPLKKWLTPRL